MSQSTFGSRSILVGSLIAAALLITAQVWARSSGPPPAQAVPVQHQSAEAPLHLDVAFSGNTLIGTVTISGKDGRPRTDVRGQAYLLDSSGRQLAVIPLHPLSPGEFRLIAPLGRLDAPGYLDVRLPGRGQASEQRGVYQVNPARRTVTWMKNAPGTGALSIQATGGPDDFGYTWDNTATYAWIDTSGGTSITLRDDEWVGPFDIGFTFDFYGQDHSQFYLDSNGYIGFDSTQIESYWANTRLPYARRPNNLIAPFWDDFDPSQGGMVRYQTFGASPNRYLVVEWSGVPLWGTSDAQSFQLILYEGSNNIKSQYPTARSGDGGDLRYATSGIENADGTIGLEYLYLIPTNETRAVQFNYSRPAYNVFLTPERQGSSAAAGEAAPFRLRVRNLGSSSDSFVLSRPTYTGSNWSVGFYEVDGTTPLSGNNTGTIAAGGEKEIVVKVQIPGSATVGNWTRATVRATSHGNPSEYHEVMLDATLGTSFAQVYTDDESGDGSEDSENYFAALDEGQRYTRRVTTDQDDSSYAGMATTPDNNAVNVWNTTYYNGMAWVSEIQYAVLNRSGGFVRPVTRLTDNSAASSTTWDFSPAVDVASNGNIAIGWARQPGTYNVWYAVVSSSGGIVKAPTALTSNTGNYPRDYPPSVAALTGGRFLLAWEHAASSSGPVDIYYAVLNNNGTVARSSTRLTDGTGWHVTPRVAALPNGQAALVWTAYNTYGYPEITYATVDSSGALTGGPTPITSNGNSGAASGYADAVALSDGRLGVAWTQQSDSDQQIQYTIISGSPLTPTPTNTPSTPTTTPTPTSTSTPTPTPTSTSTATPTPTPNGWVTLISEDFEGSFPGEWQVFDNDGASNGEYYWGKRDCRPYAGSYSGWAVGDGTDGASLGCGSNYPDSADSWMVYGPFSLTDATAGDLSFKLWLNSESGYDAVCRLASIDGTNFSGACTSGDSSGWIDRVLDLADVYSLGNLMGQSQVWVALVFISDGSINYPEGAYVDDIVLRKCTSSTCTGVSSAASDSGNAQIVDIPTRTVRTPGSTPAAVNLQRNEPAPSRPTFSPAGAVQTIHTVPNDLSAANIYVSLTTDQDDNMIMTWLDNYGAQYLFYALADKNGAIRTPATVFQRTRHSYLWSSWNGYGNDVLAPAGPPAPHIVYLPVVIRNYPPPPPPPPVTNGGFETGDFSGWTASGDASGLIPRVVTSRRRSGSYAAVLGQENAPCQTGQGGLVGQSRIYQDITVPDSGSPQLTFYHRIFTYDKISADKYDRFEVYINGTLLGRFGNTDLGHYGCSRPINDLGWQLFTYDLSAYRGQTIRLRLVNVTHPDDWYSTWTYIDDVAVTR